MDMTEEIGTEAEELEDEGQETEAVEPEKPESAHETAKAVWEELSAAADGEEPSQEAATEEAPTQGENPKKEISDAARKLASSRKGKKRQTFVPADTGAGRDDKTGAAAATTTERLEPPADWSVAEKEEFHTYPPTLQKKYIERVKNLQAHTTKLWQEYNREAGAAKAAREVVQKYRAELKIPERFTDAQVMEQYFSYQKQINTDAPAAIAAMMRHRGVTLDDLEAQLNGTAKPAPQVQPQQPPQGYLTTEEARRIFREEQQQQAQHRETQTAIEQVRALGREMQNGRYLWPELTNPEQNYIQRIQPLVTYFRETTPDWAEAYKKAIVQDRANRGIGSPSPASPRLTPKEIDPVKLASSSLRSRGGNGAIPRAAEPKSTETARESAEIAYWETIGKNQH